MRGLWTVLAGALALAACAPQDGPQPPVKPTGETSQPGGFTREMSAADRAACEQSGGTVQRRGRIGMEQCVHRFADAGKTCTDKAQCEGKCVASAVSPDTPAVGQCQADDKLYGCYAEVRDGKAPAAICVD
jgi:putative hemolysin